MVAAAVIGSAVVGAGASLIGGSMQASAANKASAAQVEASKYATDIQKQMFDQQRNDLAPYRASGGNALNQINALMGMPQVGASGVTPYSGPAQTTGAQFTLKGPNGVSYPLTAAQKAQMGTLPAGYSIVPNTGTAAAYNNPNGPNSLFQNGNNQNALATNRNAAMQSFFTDPGYEFAMEQGVNAIDRSAAARGLVNSGSTIKALDRFGQGQANQQYGNYFARLQSLAGIGQSATSEGNAAAQNFGNAASQNAINSGNARASGYINSANAMSNAYAGVGSAINSGIGNYFALNGMGGQTASYGASVPYNVNGMSGSYPTIKIG